ncbi:hypothetical protein NOCA2170004 [metagenome]|uniref:Glycosyltransferase 2-like domain-containing protein n=1 Tax=metagenome TaxID=256318 RepID=A0A2P2C135_9ZZZZ
MSGRSLGRRSVRAVGSRLPAPWRARLRQALATRPGLAVGRRLGLPGADVGLVSWVVVCEPADLERAGDCLTSLHSQWHHLVEVLVAPVGDARVPAAERDARVRVLPTQDTWYAAANAGAAEARGRYLGFVRACDTLLPHATTDLAGSLSRSGSDLATGMLTQQGQPEPWLDRAQRAAHARPAAAISSLECADLVGDLVIGNKLTSTASWRATSTRFGPDDDWLLSPTWATRLRAGLRVDVLSVPVVRHAHEHGHRPFGAMPSPLGDLPDWVRTGERIEAVLDGSPLAAGWVRQVLDTGLPRFIADTERADDGQWARLTELAAYWSARSSEPPRGVRARSRGPRRGGGPRRRRWPRRWPASATTSAPSSRATPCSPSGPARPSTSRTPCGCWTSTSRGWWPRCSGSCGTASAWTSTSSSGSRGWTSRSRTSRSPLACRTAPRSASYAVSTRPRSDGRRPGSSRRRRAPCGCRSRVRRVRDRSSWA